MRHHSWWIRALLRLYPRPYRGRYGDELADAMTACVDRERASGTGRVAIAFRLLADAVSASALLRRDRSAHQRPSGDPPMRSLLHDVRHAARLLRRAPLFAALVVVTLGLAIGANTAIFSAVNAVLLRPLPYPEPDRLVLLYESIGSGMEPFGFSAPDLVAFRERARSYRSIAAYRSVEFELSGIDQPERVAAARISASLTEVLGVSPAIGRAFTAEEDDGRQPVALLSDALWRRRFGADLSIVGRAISLDRRAYTVVGVMRPDFVFPHRGPHLNNVPAEVYVPMSFSAGELRAFGANFNKTVVARLAPGVSPRQADAEAAALTKRIVAELYPAELRDNGFTATASTTPMLDDVVGDVRRPLLVLMGAVGVLLLLACADIACLTLTRAASRGREMAIRTALGAGRGRVLRLVLAETGLLALAGGALGTAAAWLFTRLAAAPAAAGLPRASEITLDGRVLAFTALASCAAALLCGALPALQAARGASSEALKDGGRGSTSGARERRVFGALVVVQFACAIVLLASGALLVRSFAKLIATDPGFRSQGVVIASTSLPTRAYATAASVRDFYARLLDGVGGLAGVTAAGAAMDLPLTVRDRRVFTIENPPPASAGLSWTVANDLVAGRYFEAVGMRIVRGRALGPSDTPSSEPVVVVNEALATRYFGGEDPVGRRLAWGFANNHAAWMRIVGVVADVKQAGLSRPTEPQTWQAWPQVPDGLFAFAPAAFRSLNLMVRSSLPPSALVPAIRSEVQRLDPALPVTGVQTLEDVVGASAATQRFNAMVLGGFAGVALLLAAVGIAGVLAISVSRRRQEIGVRLAVGASSGDVLRMVIRQGMALVLGGLLLGLPAALATARLLRALLFDVGPYDPLSFVSATLLLCAVALAACAAPALRASRIDPIAALRID